MEINAQAVIDKLSIKLAKSEAEKAVVEVQVEALQERMAELDAQIAQGPQPEDGPIEGELVG